MIINEHIAAYLDSLSGDLPKELRVLEERALLEGVPIIKRPAQELLRFLLFSRRPKRILEIGTAVGFSCLLMNEYLSEDGKLVTIEKVAMRVAPAKENLSSAANCKRITFLIGEAIDILSGLCGREGRPKEIYLPQKRQSLYPKEEGFDEMLQQQRGVYDLIFMDAAKGQYMNFLPDTLKLLSKDGLLVTDNVLQEGSIADSKFSIPRRERTIHMRMREYLFTLTHHPELSTVVLPVGDGMTLTVKKEN